MPPVREKYFKYTCIKLLLPFFHFPQILGELEYTIPEEINGRKFVSFTIGPFPLLDIEDFLQQLLILCISMWLHTACIWASAQSPFWVPWDTPALLTHPSRAGWIPMNLFTDHCLAHANQSKSQQHRCCCIFMPECSAEPWLVYCWIPY